MLALLVQAQSTAYSNYGPDYVSQYQEIQSSKAPTSWVNGSTLIHSSLQRQVPHKCPNLADQHNKLL